MKRQNTKLDRVSIYSTLVKEGFTLPTLLKCSDQQLLTLRSKILNEVETTQAQKNVYNLGIESDEEAFKVQVTDDTLKLAPENIDIEDKTATITTDIAEEEELTPHNEPVVNVDKDGKQQTLLGSGEVNEFDMYETIMYNGAGDFDDTSFYNPDAGGFSISQGPTDSYYSTDNKGELIGAGTDQDEGQYTGNAKYIDTPSFHNPDASGFDSEGPRDSYGQSGYDEGGFAGELNEYAREVDPEPPYHFKSAGPRGHSSGLHETKKELLEKVKNDANPWAICTSKLKLTGKKKDKYTDKENEDFEACVMGVKKSTGYIEESIQREMVESWLMGLVQKYERPSMSKEQLLQTINEIAVMGAPAPVKTPTRTKPGTKPGKPDRKNPYKPKHKPNPKAEDADSDIEDAKHELPAWMDFESLFIKNEDE